MTIKSMILSFMVVITLLMVGYAFVRPHLWFQVESNALTANGEGFYGAGSFVSSKGDVLIVTPENDHYLVRKEQREVGIPNSSNFVRLIYCVYSVELEPPTVLSTNRIKIEYDMSIDFLEDSVEWSTKDGTRLRLDYNRLPVR